MTIKNTSDSGRRGQPVPPDPLQDFARGLRALRAAAGNPSYRAMEHRSACSAAALAEAESGDRLPSLAITLAYVGACGGDQGTWTRKWHLVRATMERVYDTVEFPRALPAPPTVPVRRTTPGSFTDRPVFSPERPVPPPPFPPAGPSRDRQPYPPADPARDGRPVGPSPDDPGSSPNEPDTPSQRSTSSRKSDPKPPKGRSRRGSVKTWVIAGVLAQIVVLAATLVYLNTASTAVQPQSTAADAQPTQAPDRQSRNQAADPERARRGGSDPSPRSSKPGSARPGPSFTAVAGPSCPRDNVRSVRIVGLPGRAGWKDASVPGWTGAGCTSSFLFSELEYDPDIATPPQNSFEWRFTTGLPGTRKCLVSVYIPKTGLAGQRVWYTVKDGFDNYARTIGEFTLDQRMRQASWVTVPVPIETSTGLVMVRIVDTGKGNTTGDLSLVAGPLRLTCL